MTALDWTVAAAYVLGNAIAFVVMGVDKWRARMGRYRISEGALLLCCALFGALGGWFGMQVFRHKTRRAKFTISVPVLLLLQAALLTLYIAYWR